MEYRSLFERACQVTDKKEIVWPDEVAEMTEKTPEFAT